MNEGDHRRLREHLGAYALGHLDDTQCPAIEAHLDGCAGCRAELDSLVPLSAQLLTLDPDQLSATAPAPPAELGEAIVRNLARRPQPRFGAPAARSRLRTLVPAGVAAVLIAVAGLGVGRVTAPAPATPPLESVAVQELTPGVDVTAGLVAHTWGMEVKLTGHGFTSGETYRMIVTDERGKEVTAGEFVGTGSEEMRCNLNSSVLRERASAFRVVKPGDPDTVLVKAALT